ncbi:prepilin-type N-terminal cleavage/methylation domain-containing protein [Agromyces terreus]|uniref:Prepilin-type N-terminal cleavage/methylation domain-containing protein n=1 Tax=Agromyces terreus TaxID=424795 RepID=A0A9X2H7X0_9MICO|nr:prepilin-type N-terminal cleavage/methylation domain-containing protein [Agromyces terreus]MCP2371084.1 prepilin-type N-terminal cleavage/methylation domain-containing protein [Agromyces terreus]
MIKRILESLEQRRTQLKDEDKGFTLIELLVVVIIIGILVAIAIPVYIGLQNGARDSAAQSDLTNAKIATIAYWADDPDAAAPATPLSTSLGNFGYVESDGLDSAALFSGTPTSASFCIEATSGAGNEFHITESTEVAENGC